jgi:hypothetical protein
MFPMRELNTRYFDAINAAIARVGEKIHELHMH